MMKNGAMDLLGAWVTISFYVSAILVFAFRLAGRPRVGHAIGYFELCLAIPLIILLVEAPRLGRPALYYVQVGLMLAWLAVEALLDYILNLDFRGDMRLVVGYVILFFAASGGLLGVAARAGRGYGLASVALFLVMAVLAFVQRAVTGM